MKKILVSLVSEQTVPNILAICDMQPDQLLFVSTPAMEKKNKTKHILSALAGRNCDFVLKNRVIEVAEDSILDCHRKLDEWMAGNEESEFIVNLTGGTKIMAIAVYEYFKDYGSRMIYIPFPRNEYITPFPKRLTKAVPLSTRLSVVDYLGAAGVKADNVPKLKIFSEEALMRKDLSNWLVINYRQVKNLLIWFGGALREHRKNKSFELNGQFSGATSEEQELLQRLDIKHKEDRVEKKMLKSEIQFLTGGWLEEYCFCQLYQLLGAGIDDVVLGCMIKSEKGVLNEFDVMFTKDNGLYTVECKSLDQHEDKKTDTLYKIAALQKEFGLRIDSFLVSTSPHILKDGAIKPSLAARAEQFRTTVIVPDDVKNFGNIVADKLKIK